jgi:hypothetical protein
MVRVALRSPSQPRARGCGRRAGRGHETELPASDETVQARPRRQADDRAADLLPVTETGRPGRLGHSLRRGTRPGTPCRPLPGCPTPTIPTESAAVDMPSRAGSAEGPVGRPIAAESRARDGAAVRRSSGNVLAALADSRGTARGPFARSSGPARPRRSGAWAGHRVRGANCRSPIIRRPFLSRSLVQEGSADASAGRPSAARCGPGVPARRPTRWASTDPARVLDRVRPPAGSSSPIATEPANDRNASAVRTAALEPMDGTECSSHRRPRRGRGPENGRIPDETAVPAVGLSSWRTPRSQTRTAGAAFGMGPCRSFAPAKEAGRVIGTPIPFVLVGNLDLRPIGCTESSRLSHARPDEAACQAGRSGSGVSDFRGGRLRKTDR